MTSNKLATDDSLKVTRPNVTLREIVLEKLRQAIMNFQLKPGERLVERDLCARLGVSRTSVREALRILQSEGLVEHRSGRGPRVSVMTLDEARDIYELRCHLESLIVQMFTQHATAVHMAQLEAAWEALKEKLHGGDVIAIVQAVSDLYGVLYEGAGNKAAGQVVAQLQARLNTLRATSTSRPGRFHESYREMTRIMDAIRSRNSHAAYKASVDHICNASHVALTELAKREGKAVPDITLPVSGKQDAGVL